MDRPLVLWLIGLSGAGKSTLAAALCARLESRGIRVARLDGDDLRRGLCRDLGFSPADRSENLRRAAHVAELLSHSHPVTICSFISPLEEDRERVREIVGPAFCEVFVKASLATCESRDPKGLYIRARSGEIPEFTGISAPFEAPQTAEIVVDTELLSVEDAVTQLLADAGLGI